MKPHDAPARALFGLLGLPGFVSLNQMCAAGTGTNVVADVGFLVQAGRRSIAAARPIRTVRGAGYSFDERFGRTA